MASLSVPAILQMISFVNSAPEAQQMGMLAQALKSVGPKFLGINSAQAKIIADLFTNEESLDAEGVPNEKLLEKAFAEFNEQATKPAPMRIVCGNCGTIRRVNLNG